MASTAGSSTKSDSKRKFGDMTSPTGCGSLPRPAKRNIPNFATSTKMVTIEVEDGAETQVFTIQQDFLCYYSPYFHAAFEGAFQERQTKNLTIKEHPPVVFGAFLTWIFTQKLENLEGNLPKEDILVRLWMLADMLLVPELQNLTLDAIIKVKKTAKRSHTCEYIYENTVTRSPLRRLYICYVARNLFPGYLNMKRDYPQEMLIDLACYLKDWITTYGIIQPALNAKEFYVSTDDIKEGRGVMRPEN